MQLQDKYQTLTFKEAGKNQFQRFRSTEQARLMQSIFDKEFNVQTLIEGGVIYEHFMPHTSKKHEIIESLDKHGFRLVWNMMSMSESFLNHFEPINLIADYYGEKYALYLAFLYHHVGWLIVPSIVGSVLFVYQVVIGILYQEPELTTFESYLKLVDTPFNYAYIIFIALWSTFYVESWKRKQNSIRYIWGLNEKEEQIRDSVKLSQRNTEVVYDEQQGRMCKVVMGRNTCCTTCLNALIIALFSALAIVAAFATIYMSRAVTFEDENYQNFWRYFCVFLQSILVTVLFQFYGPIAEFIVNNENLGEEEAKENSLITKNFIMASFISFSGLFVYAYWERDFGLLNLLMVFLQIFK